MREECSLLLNGADHNDAKIGIFVLYFFMLSTPNEKFWASMQYLVSYKKIKILLL